MASSWRDLPTRIALGVHDVMARRHARMARASDKANVIHDATRYDRMWGWLLGHSDGPIIELLGIRGGERVLEIGCGPGNLTASLARAVGPSGSIAAVDASVEMIERARNKSGREAIAFTLAQAEALPYPNASFDVVVSRLMLHMVGPQLETAIAEARRVLAPGGRCVLVDIPGPAIDSARTYLERSGVAVTTGEAGFSFLRYVRFASRS